MRQMKLSEIKISESFANTTPSKEKMDECRKFWEMCNKQDRYLVVNNKGYLIDGYVQYLVLKENGIEDVEIRVSHSTKKRWNRKPLKSFYTDYREQTTTYVYGIHPNDKSKKERVWRIPNNWIGWENDLFPGDKILACTKHGISPIIITRIEWLDKCPVDMPVRKICRKFKTIEPTF